MANGIATITIVGNVGKEPTTREFGDDGNSQKVTFVNVGVTPYPGPNREETTNWYGVRISGAGQKMAETLEQGDQIMVRGDLVAGTREYQGKTYIDLKISADRGYSGFTILSRKNKQNQGGSDVPVGATTGGSANTSNNEDEIPF